MYAKASKVVELVVIDSPLTFSCRLIEQTLLHSVCLWSRQGLASGVLV